jgi:hypothetical protein
MSKKPSGALPLAAMDAPDEEELEVGLSASAAPSTAGYLPATKPPADLSAFPAKLWCIQGKQGTGKTWLAVNLCEALAEKGGETRMYALDQGGRRRLADRLEGVQMPPTTDAAAGARWIGQVFDAHMTAQASGVADFGGGSEIMARVAKQMPDLADVMESKGVAPVAAYTLGPNPGTLDPLAITEAAGFRPRATLLVLVEALVPETREPAEAFARVLRHSTFRAAVDRGAQIMVMPRLDSVVADLVDAKKLLFSVAADPVRSPLGPWQAGQARFFRREFLERLDRYRTWVL